MICKNWENCGGLSDCEELVGVTHRREWSRDADKCFQKQKKYFRP